MEYEFRIPAFHSNYEENLKEFCEKNKIYISEDTHYLGDGMYFWGNRQDLEFWYNKKLKESTNKKVIKIKAQIEYNDDQVMDLTVKEDFEKLLKIFDIISRAHKEKVGTSKLALGQVINKIYYSKDTIISEYISNIKIMKIGLSYKDLNCGYISEKKDYYSKKLSKNQNIVFDVRTIYCTKVGAKVLFKEIIN